MTLKSRKRPLTHSLKGFSLISTCTVNDSELQWAAYFINLKSTKRNSAIPAYIADALSGSSHAQETNSDIHINTPLNHSHAYKNKKEKL